jgi:uncharacterized protein YaiE (UPF0345 family)
MLTVNEYFDGKVKSIALKTKTLPATVGVMAEGEYRFGTGAAETMHIISGEVSVRLPDESEWQTFIDGQVFDVKGQSSFEVKAVVDTAYFCQYWPE